MTDRERLIELLEDTAHDKGGMPNFRDIADHLLAKGVIVPPCKVGDYVLWDNGLKDSNPKLKEVKGFYYNTADLGLRYVLEGCQPIINFSSIVGVVPKEEAEAKLKELNNNA